MSIKHDERHEDKILHAAGVCILKFGFYKSSMGSIAKEAGLSRRTLYRTFANRNILFADLIELQSKKKFPKTKEFVKFNNFESAVINASAYGIKSVQEDPIMMELMHESGAQWYQDQMLDKTSIIYQRILSINLVFWEDLLNHARKNHLINPALTNYEIIEWYFNIQYMMIIRVKATEQENKDLLRKFFIPSIKK